MIRRRGGSRKNNLDKKRSSSRKNTSLQMSLMGEDDHSYSTTTTSKMRHRHAIKTNSSVTTVDFIPQQKGLKKLKQSLLNTEHIRAIVNAMPNRLQATDWKLMYVVFERENISHISLPTRPLPTLSNTNTGTPPNFMATLFKHSTQRLVN